MKKIIDLQTIFEKQIFKALLHLGKVKQWLVSLLFGQYQIHRFEQSELEQAKCSKWYTTCGLNICQWVLFYLMKKKGNVFKMPNTIFNIYFLKLKVFFSNENLFLKFTISWLRSLLTIVLKFPAITEWKKNGIFYIIFESAWYQMT